jgi:hypothetical protein
MVKYMEKVFLFKRMVILMKVIGNLMKEKVKEYIFGKMEINILEIG